MSHESGNLKKYSFINIIDFFFVVRSNWNGVGLSHKRDAEARKQELSL